MDVTNAGTVRKRAFRYSGSGTSDALCRRHLETVGLVNLNDFSESPNTERGDGGHQEICFAATAVDAAFL